MSASEAAVLRQIRTDVRHAAELAACLALRASRIAATADPSQRTLADLATAAQSVADQVRSTSAAILQLLQAPPTSPAAQPPTTDTVKRLTHANEWARILNLQIKIAIKIYALICAELSDRAAVAEEWNTEPGKRPSPAIARTLATHARTLRDSVSS